MDNKEYIHIGSPIITKDLFRQVLRPLNNFLYMPSGGLYACEYKGPQKISAWYNFLLSEEELSKQKNREVASLFTLKENANILLLDNYNKVFELTDKYPSYHQKLSYIFPITEDSTLFDFESLSEDYDGIYVNYHSFIHDRPTTTIFNDWSVDTLLLFNLDCIKSFRRVTISKDASISIDPKENTISSPSPYYQELYSKVALIFRLYMDEYRGYKYADYDEYLTIITKCITICYQIIDKDHKQTVDTLVANLQKKGITKTKETIVKNIILNYLVTYFKENKEEIKSLHPSRIKSLKQYSY